MSRHLIDRVCVHRRAYWCLCVYPISSGLMYARLSDWITPQLLWRKMVVNHLLECWWEKRHFAGVSVVTWLNLHTITPQQTCNPIYELITSSPEGTRAHVIVKMWRWHNICLALLRWPLNLRCISRFYTCSHLCCIDCRRDLPFSLYFNIACPLNPFSVQYAGSILNSAKTTPDTLKLISSEIHLKVRVKLKQEAVSLWGNALNYCTFSDLKVWLALRLKTPPLREPPSPWPCSKYSLRLIFPPQNDI